LPQASLMPTGGVSVDNAGDWIKAGCVAVGAGGNLTAGAKKGDYASITALAKQFMTRIREARAR
jgi:2-dehydro-3-deoxyphosphogluconate aldolase/(4S)-4-hydroxy-2-oxoglutarate aldolase